jgi:hypothetical protein
MKHFFIIHLLLVLGFVQAQVPELNYSQSDFDSYDCCWRKLSLERRYAEGAALIENYIQNSPNAINKHPLNWHAGQMFASAGNNGKAIKHMKKTYNILYRWLGGEEGKQWYYYAKGTIAFIKKDKKTMERMIYLWHKNKLPDDVNLKELKKLLSNWGKTYNEAY